MIRILAGICAFVAIAAFADETLYRVNSKDVGIDEIDLTISEVRREGQISVLQVPGYAKLSALEARFSMCAFTDIAIQRGFEVWIVPASSTEDVVRIGFLKSNKDDAAKLLGKDFVEEGVLRAEVEIINRMCNIPRAK